MPSTYFYSTGTVIDVRQKYPLRIRDWKVAKTFHPLNDHDGMRIIEDIFKSKAIESPYFDPIKINMVDLHTSSVLIDKSERRTGNLVDICNAETLCQTFCKQRLPCS